MNERSTQATDNTDELEVLDMWEEVEANFDVIATQAWNSTVLQIFKVFVLGRVTLNSLRTLPGEGNTLGEPLSRAVALGMRKNACPAGGETARQGLLRSGTRAAAPYQGRG